MAKRTAEKPKANGVVNRAKAALRAALDVETEDGEAPKAPKLMRIPALELKHFRVTLDGDSPLICHAWSKKARDQILSKQMQEATQGREAKDPDRDFQESLYRTEDGDYGFPSIAFKNAAVEACTSLGKTITKIAARQAFHVQYEHVKIDGPPRRREDMVRVGQGSADIRYRAEFPKWSVTLDIVFNSRVLSAEQIINMLNTAGFAVGVGDYRPERNGAFGRFHVRGGLHEVEG
jgi:hypothetical protein